VVGKTATIEAAGRKYIIQSRWYGISATVSLLPTLNSGIAGESPGERFVHSDQCSGPGGVLLASWTMAAEIRRQVSAPS
jgi:hypothetical protein